MSSAPFPSTSQIGPYVATGRKDLVTTSLGPGRVWATVGEGIPTEIYWPTPGEVETRDLGFIIADGTGWWVEVKSQADYEVQWARSEGAGRDRYPPGACGPSVPVRARARPRPRSRRAARPLRAERHRGVCVY